MKKTLKMNTAAKTILDELLWFAVECGGAACFPGWDEELLRSYLVFHLKQGTAGYVRQWEAGPGAKRILALGIGWQFNECETHDPEFVKKPFRWQETNAAGDSFLFCDLMAIDRPAMGVLASEFQWRWPNWRRLKLFSIRRGKLVRYENEKFMSKVEGL